MNDLARRGVVFAVIRKHNVSVVCLQETKLQFIDISIVKQCCGPLFTEFCYAPADGTRGGILIAWKPDTFQCSVQLFSPWSVAINGKLQQTQKNLNLFAVYGPQSDPDKVAFLQELQGRITSDLPPNTATIVVGDFNMIVKASDKSNTNVNRRNMARFRKFINDMQLKDLYLHGRRYTWSNEQQVSTMVKLDRVLFNQEWDINFPSCMLQAISSEISDHCPILLSSDADFKPTRSFKFEHSWVTRDDFLEVVQNSWNSVPQHVDPFINLHVKLTTTAQKLTKWSAQFCSDLQLRAAISSELIFMLDQAMDRRQLTDAERQFRASLKMTRLGIEALQRTQWRQRSRILWLREGDANTRFFHAKASARRRKNFIHRVEFDNVVHTEQEGKLDAFWQFFHQLLGQSRPRQHTLNLQALDIQPLNFSDKEAPITPEEVLAAISDLPSDKAPGSDGFTALFFKKCWSIIKFDIMRAVSALECCTSRSLHLLNSANMILLPKTPEAAHPSQFRPISLIHFFAKLFTKILARRLRPRMHELVHPCQSAFIKSRAIHDNFVFVRAQARLFRQKKFPALLLKLDLQKAFDSLSWEFLLEVLEAKGFGQRWRDWIACLLYTATTKIIVNGEFSRRIFHRRGLRQGDPLSPQLFVIVTDVLAALFAMADRVGALKTNRYLLAQNRISLYADDVVIFTEPDQQELQSVKLIMQCFGEASGLITNFKKSSILPIHCSHLDVTALAAILSCPVQNFPCTYLGLPLSDQRLRKADLQPYLDKLAAKVKGWNKGNFSLDARLLLVKHVLSAMHIHHLLVIDPPAWLIKAIDKLRRGFLWCNDELAIGGRCLVRWAAICRPPEFGGLGIVDLQRKATALRVRWLWHSWTQTDKAWSNLPLGIDDRARNLFNSAVSFNLGDGKKISFWKDPCSNGQSLATIAPELF